MLLFAFASFSTTLLEARPALVTLLVRTVEELLLEELLLRVALLLELDLVALLPEPLELERTALPELLELLLERVELPELLELERVLLPELALEERVELLLALELERVELLELELDE